MAYEDVRETGAGSVDKFADEIRLLPKEAGRTEPLAYWLSRLIGEEPTLSSVAVMGYGGDPRGLLAVTATPGNPLESIPDEVVVWASAADGGRRPGEVVDIARHVGNGAGAGCLALCRTWRADLGSQTLREVVNGEVMPQVAPLKPDRPGGIFPRILLAAATRRAVEFTTPPLHIDPVLNAGALAILEEMAGPHGLDTVVERVMEEREMIVSVVATATTAESVTTRPIGGSVL